MTRRRSLVIALGFGMAVAGGCSRQSSGLGDAGGDGSADATTDASTSATSTSTDGTDGTDSSEGGESTGDSSGFMPMPDLIEDGPECDLWAQDCPDGEKCTMVWTPPGGAWNDWACVPVVTNPAGVGEPCNRFDDPIGADTCDDGSLCYDVDPNTGLGTCVGFCQAPENSPTCEISVFHCKKLSSQWFALCVPPCNPLLAGECPVDQECFVTHEGQVPSGTICFPPAAAGASGEACTCAECCAAQHMCVNQAEYGPGCAFGYCCTELCDINDSAFQCAGQNQACVPVFPPGTPVLGDVGRCVVVP